MSKSILVKEFNKANKVNKDIKVFYQTINVSFLDVINGNEVELNLKDYKDCLCKDNTHIHDYFATCKKCEGKGYLVINNHKLTCNECKGEQVIRIHDCYLCNNESKLLMDTKMKIKLNSDLKSDDTLRYDFKDYSLVLKINIYDEDDYLRKGNDIYYLKSVLYSKKDYESKTKKCIYTGKNKHYLTSEFKVKKEIVKLDKDGINEGDFYFIFENELDNEKEVIYTNVLIDKKGYFKLSSLINDELVSAKINIALNENDYAYIDENVNEYETDKYIIKFNKLDDKVFFIENNKLVYHLYLDKDDLNNDKKSFVLNNEKINVNYKKNLKEVMYVNVNDKVYLNKEGKRKDLLIKIIPYFENIYKISIKKNKKEVYIEDYKYNDYSLVETFKKSDYLSDFITINDEEKIVVNNDLVLIKRV